MSGMSSQERARFELETARNWLEHHKRLGSKFTRQVVQPHPFVWFGEVMEVVATAIAAGDLEAIELGCHYIIDDPVCPFGRILKRKVLKALRRKCELIPSKFQAALIKAPAKFDSHPFKPHEYKDLLRLAEALSKLT